MNTAFWIVTILFMVVSLGMVLIILVQRPSGGGLAGAFGGAGGSGSDTVFGGRVGDALTWATVVAFILYLGFAIALNLLDEVDPAAATGTTGTSLQAPTGGSTTGGSTIDPIIQGDTLGEITGKDNLGEQDDSDQPTAEDLPDDSTDDSAGDSTDDKLEPTTTEDPTTKDPPGGEN